MKMDNREKGIFIMTLTKTLSENTRLRYRRLKIYIILKLVRMFYNQVSEVMFYYVKRLYPPRRSWALDRPHSEFERYIYRINPDLGYWKDNFRMSRETFEYIVDIAEPFMKKKDSFSHGNTNSEASGRCSLMVGTALSAQREGRRIGGDGWTIFTPERSESD